MVKSKLKRFRKFFGNCPTIQRNKGIDLQAIARRRDRPLSAQSIVCARSAQAQKKFQKYPTKENWRVDNASAQHSTHGTRRQHPKKSLSGRANASTRALPSATDRRADARSETTHPKELVEAIEAHRERAASDVREEVDAAVVVVGSSAHVSTTVRSKTTRRAAPHAHSRSASCTIKAHYNNKKNISRAFVVGKRKNEPVATESRNGAQRRSIGEPTAKQKERKRKHFLSSLVWLPSLAPLAMRSETEAECSIFFFSEIESFKDTRCGSFPGWVQKQKLEFSLRLKLKLK